MKCAYDDCDFEETAEQKFIHIKTYKGTNKIRRGRLCPKCNRSFTGIETFVAIPFLKKEQIINEYKTVSKSERQA